MKIDLRKVLLLTGLCFLIMAFLLFIRANDNRVAQATLDKFVTRLDINLTPKTPSGIRRPGFIVADLLLPPQIDQVYKFHESPQVVEEKLTQHLSQQLGWQKKQIASKTHPLNDIGFSCTLDSNEFQKNIVYVDNETHELIVELFYRSPSQCKWD